MNTDSFCREKTQRPQNPFSASDGEKVAGGRMCEPLTCRDGREHGGWTLITQDSLLRHSDSAVQIFAALRVLGVSRLHYISVRQAALNVRVFCVFRGLIPVLSLCSLRFRHLKLFDTMGINI
jgi:hypothetical protein